MDIDRYIAANEPVWQSLAAYTARARGNLRTFGPDEVEAYVQLYQQSSANLSYVRTYYRDSALTGRLTAAVADARAVIYGTRGRSLRALGHFFAYAFPGAVWHNRRMVLISAALTFLPAIAVGTWLANSDAAIEASAPEAVREALIDREFEAYYSSEPAAAFSTKVLVNNILVSFNVFALGIFFCAGSAYVLAYNGANVGVAAGLFHHAGDPQKFWGLILPHGLLELSAVVIAGAAGLRLGWTVINPGDRTRVKALAAEGQRSVVIVLGLVVAFIIAGLIEGFVTPSGLPTSMRVGIGVIVQLAFVSYLVVQGRAAAAMGLTGRLSEAG